MRLAPFPILTLFAPVLLAAALAVHAQQPGKVYRIGTVSHLEKGRRDVRRLVSMLLLLVLSTAFAGCGFVGARPASVAATPGFVVGVWDGLIAPWTLLLRAFIDMGMYAVPNSGWWYDAGFLLGITGSIPLGWIAALIAIAQHVF